MDIETIREYCLKKKATFECFPFDEVDLDRPEWISMKCDPEYAIELREHYRGIEPAYHFNKKYWNQVSLEADVPDHLILSLIDHSYDEVIKKFTRKQRVAYNELS